MKTRETMKEQKQKTGIFRLVCDDRQVLATIPSAKIKRGGNAFIFEIKEYPHRVAKIFKEDGKAYPNRLKRFLFEIETLKYIHLLTNKVPRFYCKGNIEESGEPFYIMEKLDTVEELIDAGLNCEEKFELVTSLLNAIEELHELDLAHRDIKPRNMLFRNKDGHRMVVLTDLGLVMSDDRDGYDTNEFEMLGSEGYRPFELRQHNPALQTRDYFASDIYQFAKTTYAIFNDSIHSFSDMVETIGKDLEIEKYDNKVFIEIIYKMIEKCIVNDFSKRPNLIECRKMIDEAFNEFKKDLDIHSTPFIKDRDYRRLNSRLHDSRGYYGEIAGSQIDALKSFFVKQSAFTNYKNEEYKIIEILNNDTISVNDEWKIVEGTSKDENLQIFRRYKLSCLKSDIPVELDFLLQYVFIDNNNGKDRCAHIFVREIDTSADMVHKNLEEFILKEYGSLNNISMNLVFKKL